MFLPNLNTSSGYYLTSPRSKSNKLIPATKHFFFYYAVFHSHHNLPCRKKISNGYNESIVARTIIITAVHFNDHKCQPELWEVCVLRTGEMLSITRCPLYRGEVSGGPEKKLMTRTTKRRRWRAAGWLQIVVMRYLPMQVPNKYLSISESLCFFTYPSQHNKPQQVKTIKTKQKHFWNLKKYNNKHFFLTILKVNCFVLLSRAQ